MSDAAEEEDTPQPLELTHVFINYLDSYLGRNLSELLTGEAKAAVFEDEEGEEEEEDDEMQKNDTYIKVHGVKRDSTEGLEPGDNVIIGAAEASDRDVLLASLELCDVIIYDVTVGGSDMLQEATWVVETLHDRLDMWPKRKTFILISTVMTWAKSKPADPDDPEAPFIDDDYRKRRAHPHFQEHLNLEKNVFALGKTNKRKFKTYVIAAGATFGKGEDIFQTWMKEAWHSEKELTLYGRGNNVIPTIHILDLAQLIQYVFEARPLTRYILAVDGISNTQREIVKAISSELTTGRLKKVDKEDIYLTDLPVLHADLLITDLKMEGIMFGDNIEVRNSEMGFVEGILDVIKEYKKTRNLHPVRICILGPPLSGKSFLAEKLAKVYKIPHLTLGEIIEKAIQDLEDIAHPPVKDEPPVILPDEEKSQADVISAHGEEGEEEQEEVEVEVEEEVEEEEEDDGEKMSPEEAEDILQELKEQREINKNGRLDEATVLEFVQDRINSKPCRNQGFILDGYPKTVEQAEVLFGIDEDDERGETGEPHYNRSTMPDLVVVLGACDEFLSERAINLPEELVQGTHWTEEGVLRRLAEYRAINKEDVTVLNFFDEQEVHPLLVDVAADAVFELQNVMQVIMKKIGVPRHYALTKHEQDEEDLRLAAEKKEAEVEKKEEEERYAKEEMASRRSEQMMWAEKIAEVKRQELEALEARSLPLRNYLMKHVIPSLTQGLLECAKVKPEDPVDFLAEYLFKNNPQTNLVEWEELQRSKLEAKEASRKKMMEEWLKEEILTEEEEDSGEQDHKRDDSVNTNKGDSGVEKEPPDEMDDIGSEGTERIESAGSGGIDSARTKNSGSVGTRNSAGSAGSRKPKSAGSIKRGSSGAVKNASRSSTGKSHGDTPV